MEEKFEFQANFNGDKNIAGSLIFSASGVEFYEDFALFRPLEICLEPNEIQEINFIDTADEVYQPGIFRILFLGILAFGRPKNWRKKSCRIEIAMVDGNFYYFTIGGYSALDIRAYINQVISRYFQ